MVDLRTWLAAVETARTVHGWSMRELSTRAGLAPGHYALIARRVPAGRTVDVATMMAIDAALAAVAPSGDPAPAAPARTLDRETRYAREMLVEAEAALRAALPRADPAEVRLAVANVFLSAELPTAAAIAAAAAAALAAPRAHQVVTDAEIDADQAELDRRRGR